ncbi:MAG TPA: hypothetical protein PK537_00455 [Candidatus Limiplasma sp.]|nr:hypothetical protein [Candidatus Limiplasma sp.]
MAYGERYGKFYAGGGPRAPKDQPARRNPETWLQRLIAACLNIGIPKRALLEDYYPAELPLILRAWADLHGGGQSGRTETVDPMTFFGSGGETIDG